MTICILTDSAVQFPNPVFEGRNLVSILPTRWNNHGEIEDGHELKAADLPESIHQTSAPELQTPSSSDIGEAIRALGGRCSGVLAILHSAQFSHAYGHTIEAAEELQGNVPIRVIDSHTTSLGLGMLVEIAADAAKQGQPLNDIELHIRSLLPRIYSLLCIPGLSYLQRRGYLNSAQSRVGEYLGMLPIFTLDNGELLPGEKARNTRHLVELLHEFLAEFSDLDHVAIMQGAPPFDQETRALRERLAEDHKTTPVSEQIIGAPLASQIGPRSLGIFALQGS
ncbi:MAG: DegV family EDD domain-containing protein [Chloroflexi bacterium]|nr:DegV family EDD domain-containing protein [Chloroflexota bacterium]MQC26015.1 DegV family EDD domain-containing protein [Chloroflexota bacterium]